MEGVRDARAHGDDARARYAQKTNRDVAAHELGYFGAGPLRLWGARLRALERVAWRVVRDARAHGDDARARYAQETNRDVAAHELGYFGAGPILYAFRRSREIAWRAVGDGRGHGLCGEVFCFATDRVLWIACAALASRVRAQGFVRVRLSFRELACTRRAFPSWGRSLGCVPRTVRFVRAIAGIARAAALASRGRSTWACMRAFESSPGDLASRAIACVKAFAVRARSTGLACARSRALRPTSLFLREGERRGRGWQAFEPDREGCAGGLRVREAATRARDGGRSSGGILTRGLGRESV